jgi:hypothetical protein
VANTLDEVPGGAQRDHLFISYATEDGAFAEWLALKLTALGYKVWCDRFKLLGGESYPTDIDRAIKEQTFRFLALLSRSSLEKANPKKERTLALNLARKRGEDFVIPLNLDGLTGSDLDWMNADLTFVPFHPNWAEGLRQLIAKLERVGAPRTTTIGGKTVETWLDSRDALPARPETLWSNLLEVKNLPNQIIRSEWKRPLKLDDGVRWPSHADGDRVRWSLERPPTGVAAPNDVSEHSWDVRTSEGLSLRNVMVNLLRRAVEQHSRVRGLTWIPEEKTGYFATGALPNDRIDFVRWDGKKTHVHAIGFRTVRRGGRETKLRYHLAPTIFADLRLVSVPVVQLGLRLQWFGEDGRPLPKGGTHAITRKVRGNWWNHRWIARVFAVASWLADGADEFHPCASLPLSVAGRPLCLSSPVGFDDDDLTADDDDEVEAMIDDDEFADENDAEGGS